MKKRLQKGLKELALDFLAFMVGFVVAFGVVLYFTAQAPLLKARRMLIILIFGYGGDFIENIPKIIGALAAAVRALFEIDYARDVLVPWRRGLNM